MKDSSTLKLRPTTILVKELKCDISGLLGDFFDLQGRKGTKKEYSYMIRCGERKAGGTRVELGETDLNSDFATPIGQLGGESKGSEPNVKGG